MAHIPFNPFSPAGFDAPAMAFSQLVRRSFDMARRVGELNLQLTHQLLQDASAATRQIMGASNPMHMTAEAFNSAQPWLDHVRNYQQQLLGLMTVFEPQASQQALYQQPSPRPRPEPRTGADPLGEAVRADDAATAAAHTRLH